MDHLYHGYVSHNQRLFSHVFFYENDLFHLDELYEYTPRCIRAPLHLQPGSAMAMAVRTVVTDAVRRGRNARPAGTRGALGPRWRYPRILAGKGSEIKPGWWFQPLWKIWKSVGIIIPNIWKNKKCSKPPTRNLWSTSKICLMCIFENDQNLRIVKYLSHCLSSYPHTGLLSWWHLSKRDPMQENAFVNPCGLCQTPLEALIFHGFRNRRFENDLHRIMAWSKKPGMLMFPVEKGHNWVVSPLFHTHRAPSFVGLVSPI